MSVAVQVDLRWGKLTISGVLLNRLAWQALDLKLLWQAASVRGEDRVLPGTTGVKAYRRRATVTAHSIPFVICGAYAHDDTPQDPVVGLQRNIDYLRSNVVDPTNVGDGTRPAVLTMPDNSTRTGNIHVIGMPLGSQAEGNCLATLDIEVPLGTLV